MTQWASDQRGLEPTSELKIISSKFTDQLLQSFERFYETQDLNFPKDRKQKLRKWLKAHWTETVSNRECSQVKSFLPKMQSEQIAIQALAKIFLGAIDPHTTFFTKEEFEDFYGGLSGSQSGFGIVIQKASKGLRIEKVISDSPAQKAGIKAGDLILKVNSQDLGSLSFKDSAELLKQRHVELTIASSQKVFKTSLVKSEGVFQDQLVSLKLRKLKSGKKIAWLKIPSFYGVGGFQLEKQEEERSSSQDLHRFLVWLRENKNDHEGMILDLRGNPGGYIEEAIQIAGYFIGSKPVVSVRSKNEVKILNCQSCYRPEYEKPLVVLVDQETASSAEILTAALKEYKRALIVGSERTFGKGTVQKLLPLDDPFLDLGLKGRTGVLKLTTSQFYSPYNRSPEGEGIRSDLIISQLDQTINGSDIQTIFDEIAQLDFAPGFWHHTERSLLGQSAPEEEIQD